MVMTIINMHKNNKFTN